jgi:hypothetical protein
LGSLIELGVHPTALGVSTCHKTMLRAWEDAGPRAVPTQPKVHVNRQVLDDALESLAINTAGVSVDPDARAEAFETVFDATGRRALTASRIHRPTQEWVARVRMFEGRFSPAQGAFRISALPWGYAYRLGTADRLCLGLVAPLDEVSRFAQEWRDEFGRWGAGWLISGLPADEASSAGRGGACSVQWAEGARACLVGDAAFAPDILAAQGLSLGLTRGLAITGAEQTRPDDGIAAHITALRESLQQCRWRTTAAWAGYDASLVSLAFNRR